MTIPFHRSYLRSRLKKIWAFGALAMLALPCAAYLGPVVAIIVWLAFASTYMALFLLTRCPKCGNQVLGDGFSSGPGMRVPDKCPFCGHPVEPDPNQDSGPDSADLTLIRDVRNSGWY